MNIEEKRFTSWNGLLEFYQERFELTEERSHQLWVFRGQADATWELRTAMDRACDSFKALRRLYIMNISRETLFPGLDGLAQSLQTRLVSPEILVPNWRKKRSPAAFSEWSEP